MSEDREINSAEAEAERILEDEFLKVDLTGEDCPQGDACAVHFRNDEVVIEEDVKFGRLISYVGDYVIVTSDNPDLESPVFLIKMVLGQVKPDQIPPLYETTVLYVGEGALADLRLLDLEGRKNSIRHVSKHNSWEGFQGAHEATVVAVGGGLIDLSTPVNLDGGK